MVSPPRFLSAGSAHHRCGCISNPSGFGILVETGELEPPAQEHQETEAQDIVYMELSRSSCMMQVDISWITGEHVELTVIQ